MLGNKEHRTVAPGRERKKRSGPCNHALLSGGTFWARSTAQHYCELRRGRPEAGRTGAAGTCGRRAPDRRERTEVPASTWVPLRLLLTLSYARIGLRSVRRSTKWQVSFKISTFQSSHKAERYRSSDQSERSAHRTSHFSYGVRLALKWTLNLL